MLAGGSTLVTRAAALALALVTCGAVGSSNPPQPIPTPPPEIRIGVMAPEGGRYDVLHEWTFLRPALERALPGYVVRLENLDVRTLRDVVARSQADFFIANSGFFVEMESAHGATALATVDSPNALSPQEALGSAIVVLAGRKEIAGLADLAGKRIVAVNEQLFGGFQVGMKALHDAGVDRDDLASVRAVEYPPTEALELLLRGHADAAILRVCLLEQMTASQRYPRAAFRVLQQPAHDRFRCARSTPLYPDWAFARLKTTHRELARTVALTLLAMPPTPDGYSWTVPTNYERVHEVLRDLELGPYEYLSRRNAGGFLRRYKTAFAAIVLLALFGVAHVIRAESVVARRTRELRRMIDERDRMAAESRQREEQLEHLSRLGMLGELSSMLAHELNQPLAAIANFANGIRRRIAAGTADTAPLDQAAAAIAAQSERAGAIMERVRSFARKGRSPPAVVDLRDVVQDTAAMFEHVVSGATPITLRRDPSCAHAPYALIDKLQIEQLLLNLFKNAHDASQESADRRIHVDLSCDDEGFRVDVRDAGCGLPDASLVRLFQPFFTTKPQGVGLGLAICKRVVEAHGGRIFASSNAPQPGLTVSFTLPRAAQDATAAAAAAQPPAQEAWA